MMHRGVVIFIYRKNPLQLLLVKNRRTGNTTPVAGKIEDGETFLEAAKREILEEIG